MRLDLGGALALAAILVAACGKGSAPAPTPTPPPVVAPPVVASIADAAPDAATTANASPIPSTTTQLITVVVPDWDDTNAEIALWKRDGDRWVAVGAPWQAVVGKSGSGWGAGLHGAGPPANRTGPTKREGDGKSPAGVFALAGTYGYGATAPATTGLPYQQVTTSWKCVDDPKSTRYNQILDQRTATKDWTSAEEMKRSDELYTWVVDIAHNAQRTPGAGSCIFLHVWGGPGSATVGCTAMDATKLRDLMATLAPTAKPALVLLPRAEYDALTPVWRLPTK